MTALSISNIASAEAIKHESIPSIDQNVLNFINDPWEIFTKHKIPKGFRIIILSNLAEYIGNIKQQGRLNQDESRLILATLIKIAFDQRVSPYKDIFSGNTILGDHGLYLSHLNIILGAYKYAAGNDDLFAINKRISEYLCMRSLADKYFHMPSYAKTPLRWPADQCVVLYSLYLYDKNYKKNLSTRLIALWLEFMKKNGMNTTWQLPVSEITGGASYSKYPRGCALSWSVRYMDTFAPEKAIEIWKQYKKIFLVKNKFMAGFREWPPGIEFKADNDSGPIFFGIGSAASGFGLFASKVIGDRDTYNLLKTSDTIVDMMNIKELKRAQSSILYKAVLLNAETHCLWYKD